MLRRPKPTRINFHCIGELSAVVLSTSLCQIASFLQTVNPYSKLHTQQDGREHGVSGWPFTPEKPITFHDFFRTVGSPRELLWASSDDEGVFLGIAPDDNSWYLRFRVGWDEEGFNLVGRFDFTLPTEMAETFRREVLADIPAALEEQDADAYFGPIGPLP